MRCYSCNKNMNDFESTRKSTSGEYLDLCNKCIKGLDIDTVVRQDLQSTEPAPDDYEDIGPEFLDEMDESEVTWEDS